MDVLFISVGGTPEPIVADMEENNQDLTYFIVSKSGGLDKSSRPVVDGEYKDWQGVKKPNIVETLGLDVGDYKVIEVEADDPYKAFEVIYPIILKHMEAKDNVAVNYTGGTTSMTSALFSAAAEFSKVKFRITTARRQNLIKVEDGLERIKKFSTNKIYIERQLNICHSLLEQRNFNAAHEILRKLSNGFDMEEEDFEDLFYLTLGLEHWDKFEYEAASKSLQLVRHIESFKPYHSVVSQLVSIIKWAEEWTEESKGNPTHSGFILVYDLLRNAERKAELKLFDDAVARIYRALEMYEQFCLFTHRPAGYDTKNIVLERLPEEIQTHYEHLGESFELSLVQGYDLLTHLDHPVGQVWKKYRSKLMNKLKIRNNSYLAHGFSPVNEADFNELKIQVWEFVNECDNQMKFKQPFEKYKQLPNKFL